MLTNGVVLAFLMKIRQVNHDCTEVRNQRRGKRSIFRNCHFAEAEVPIYVFPNASPNPRGRVSGGPSRIPLHWRRSLVGGEMQQGWSTGWIERVLSGTADHPKARHMKVCLPWAKVYPFRYTKVYIVEGKSIAFMKRFAHVNLEMCATVGVQNGAFAEE
jgi:hypothetical protein